MDAWALGVLERLGRAVDKMRADDPARYRGVRSAKIIADKVAETGGKVSERTVYRDLAAVKARKEALEAQGGLDPKMAELARRGAARPADVIAASKLPAAAQRAAADAYAEGGAESMRRALAQADPAARAKEAARIARRAIRALKELEGPAAAGSLDRADAEAIGRAASNVLRALEKSSS